MSIYDAIDYHVQQGRLFVHRPAMPGATVKREMFTSSDIQALIDGPWPDQEWEERCGYLRADLDRFVEGMTLTVGRRGNCYLKQLSPVSREVWEIRSRDPSPSIRVFGRFADTNKFVALTWAKRPDLGGPDSHEWRYAIKKCKAEWQKLFPAYTPKTGGNLHDYLTRIVLV